MLLLTCFILSGAYAPARAQKADDAKKAQALYEKALQKKSVAERMHLLEQAAQFFDGAQSSTISPENARQAANIHGALGREFYQQARWQAAITHLEKALAFDASLLPAHAMLGLAYFQQGQYDAAIKAYNLVLRTQPNAQLYNNLGAAHEAKGDPTAAVAAYSRALELDASLNLAQKNLQRVQAKLARLAAHEAAFNDSVRLAAKAQDSLAAVTAKSRKGNSNTKTAKESKASLAHKSTAPSSGKQAVNLPKSKEAAAQATIVKRKEALQSPVTGQSQSKTAMPSSPQPSSAALEPPTAVPAKSNPAETSIPRAAESSGSWVGPITFGISALLLAVLIAIQRRRLGHAWMQLKPALAASTAVVSRHMRLLPLRVRNELAARYERARQVKLLPIPKHGALAGAPLEAESPETTTAPKDTPEELRQPSLQTQAFFAEMIAAEPDIEEFDGEVLASSNEAAVPANRRLDHASAEPPVSPVVVDISKEAESPLLPLQAIEPTAPKNGRDGEFAINSAASLTGPAIGATNEERIDVDSNIGYAFSINWPEESGIAPSTSSRSPAEVLAQQDSQPKGSEGSSAEGLSATSKQLSASSTQATGNSISQPATSSQQPATSRNTVEAPLQRDDEMKRREDPATIATKVFGRYVIERKIGKGAMGNIYLALDPKLDRRVVIKTVCFSLATSETDTLTLKDRVYREARAIAKLGHPNIVVVYDVEDDKEMSYIVMEHIEGQDIRQALASEHRFEAGRAIKIVSQVCNALDYAHQAGIIHRDIKPSNIMLLPGDKAKVTDFGIAKIADNFSLTLPGHVLGTPSYMAPEQFEGMDIDGRADIFSLGVVFYELITGCRPFAGNSLASLAYKTVHKMHIPPSLQNVELPLEIDEIVGRALAKNPEERYATAMEFREALQALQIEMTLSEVELAH